METKMKSGFSRLSVEPKKERKENREYKEKHQDDLMFMKWIFAFNLSLAAINVAKTFAKEQNLNLSIADSKLLMHNAMMIQRFLSAFGEIPNPHKNQGLKEHYFKELMLFGLKSAV